MAKLNRRQIKRTWVREGGNPKYKDLMAAIALRESSGNTKANNAGLNSNGTVDHGLYQVNDVWRKDPVVGPLFRSGAIYTKKGNTKAAIHILKVQGPAAWATFNPATDTKYLSGLGTGPRGDARTGKAEKTSYKLTKSKYVPSTGQPGSHQTDMKGAMLEALLSTTPGKPFLGKFISNVTSGAYDSETPDTFKPGRVIPAKLVEQAAGNDKQAKNGEDNMRLRRGKVQVASGADRAGVPTKPIVTKFLQRASSYAGHKIVVTTGSNHSQMTTSGRTSDHWDGHAGDIAVPIDSRKGDQIAYGAFRAAGVSKKQAREWSRKGGLYNVMYKGHRIQIIWKTYEGGNHHNHVHVGVR